MIDLSGFPDIPKATKEPKAKTNKEPKTKANKEPKTKTNKEPKTKANNEPKIKEGYRIEIVLDERERDLFAAMQGITTGISIKHEVMPIGDAALCLCPPGTDAPTLLQIYERKSVSDLLASIQDGRYKEQSFRMLGSLPLPPHNMVYLIEGPLVKDAKRRQRVFSAMTSIQYFKGMSVMRTGSVAETAELLLRTAEKIERDWNDPVKQKERSQTNPVGYATVVATGGSVAAIKSDNITPDNIGELLLSTIPGISTVTAKAILQRFGTFGNLMKELLDNPTGSLFEEIRNEGGRRINASCINNLRRFLLCAT